MNWPKSLKNNIKSKVFLKDLTTFKIGGLVEYFVEPKDIDELREVLLSARKNKIKVFLIGSGSNILASDKALKAIAVKLSAQCFKEINFKNNLLSAGAGCSITKLILEAKKRSLSGLEYFSGIPGTLGGALVMNAGSNEKNIGDLVEDVTIMDYNGAIKTLREKRIIFSYRNSNLSGKIVLKARLKLVRRSKDKIVRTINKLIFLRKEKQDWGIPSAGCVFKNPKNNSAGLLIDLCGLKGRRAGDACVSLKHANFILNLGQAKSQDVLKLMRIIQKSVLNKFNLVLKPEIKIWK